MKNKVDLIINISAKLGDNIIGMKSFYNYDLKNNSILINNNYQIIIFLKKIKKIKKVINLPKYSNRYFLFNSIRFSFNILILNTKIKNIIYLGEKDKYYYYFKILFLFRKISVYNSKLTNIYEKNLNLMKNFILIKSKKLNYDFKKYFLNDLNYIIIGLGSETWIYRSFSVDKWTSILNLISKEFPKFKIILVGRGKNDDLLANEIKEKLPNISIINLVNKTNISELVSLLKYAKVNLVIDSGLYHLVNLISSNLIVFFGPDSPKKWFDYNRKNSFLFYSNLSCSPCQQNWTNINWKCPFNSKCLNENISNQKIIDIMKKII